MVDYYPFGSPMRTRNLGPSAYRYGFNGMETNSPEMESYTTEFRQYDPGLGRWMSRDPLVYDDESPYSFVSNNPLNLTDPDGLKGKVATPKPKYKPSPQKTKNMKNKSTPKSSKLAAPSVQRQKALGLDRFMPESPKKILINPANANSGSKNKADSEANRRIDYQGRNPNKEYGKHDPGVDWGKKKEGDKTDVDDKSITGLSPGNASSKQEIVENIREAIKNILGIIDDQFPDGWPDIKKLWDDLFPKPPGPILGAPPLITPSDPHENSSIEQKKDTIKGPTVTDKSGNKSNTKIIRENGKNADTLYYTD